MKYLITFALYFPVFVQVKKNVFNITSRSFNNSLLLKRSVVGGAEVKPNSFRYQVGLFIQMKNIHIFCGGSIISDEYVLTAAHCIKDSKAVELLFGAHKIFEDEPTQQRMLPTEFIIHEHWGKDIANDIALIKLPKKIIFNDVIQPIKLPCYSDREKSLTFRLATISGWGKESNNSANISPVLRSVQAVIMMNPLCKLLFLGIPGKSHICTTGWNGISACYGDSGGPVSIDGVQHGITSFIIRLGCNAGWPSVHTRVSSFLPWIHNHTRIHICE